MKHVIDLPEGDWQMRAFGNAVYLISPNHPPILVEGGEVKEIAMAEAEPVFFAYDAYMNTRRVEEEEKG